MRKELCLEKCFPNKQYTGIHSGSDPDPVTAFSACLSSLTKKLQEYGFEVEMDDFGSGYSSLHMLKEVPVNRIKLDLHFLTESGDPEKGRKVVNYMIQMVRALGMRMITEGAYRPSTA